MVSPPRTALPPPLRSRANKERDSGFLDGCQSFRGRSRASPHRCHVIDHHRLLRSGVVRGGCACGNSTEVGCMASTAENQCAPRVFISYSHDSAEYCNRVLEFATRLRADGLNAQLDQFENSPPRGWPLWCARQIIDSNYVLMICTAPYRDRFLGLEAFGKGRGVKWEAKVIQNILYYNEVNSGFIPVIFDPSDEEHIPETVKEASWYLILQNAQDSSGYTQLRQRLAGGKTFPPLPIPLPSEAYRQRDDASVPTEEVWNSSRRIEEKLDSLRRLEKRQHRTVMASFAGLALLLIAGIIWFKSSTEEIVTNPDILRTKLEEKIKQSFEQKHKELVSRKATP